MQRKCRKCGEIKVLEEFHTHQGCKYGRTHTCLTCHRKYNREWAREHSKGGWTRYVKSHPNWRETARAARLKRVYGITLKQFNQMLKEQNGVCAICGKPEVVKGRGGKIKTLSVDHNHETGKVRGLLCTKCNSNLGWFETKGTEIFKYLDVTLD